MKKDFNKINLELSNLLGIFTCLTLSFNKKNLLDLLDYYTNLDNETRNLIGPLILENLR